MRTVFSAIEDGKIAIVSLHPRPSPPLRGPKTDLGTVWFCFVWELIQIESPTGTGKSLTLLTATISWLRADQTRREDVQVEALENKMREEYENGSFSSFSRCLFFVVVLGVSLGVRYFLWWMFD
jgi:Rad3-related DNA helicase